MLFSRNANRATPEPRIIAPAETPKSAAAPAPTKAATSRRQDPQLAYLDLKMRIHGRLLDMINLAALEAMEPEVLRREASEVIRSLVEEEKSALPTAERNSLVADVLDELVGYGPIEPLLKDPTVNDILINGPSKIFVERSGKLEQTSARFQDDRHLMRILNKIVSAVGRRVDESCPLVDARLPDGSRVNAVVPPIALDGASVSIRKFSKTPFSMERMVEIGSLTPEIVEILQGIVRGRLNVIVSGGTGTGKTTMLNALSCSIDHAERIVTVEDAAELQLQQPHVVRLETRPANIENQGEIAQRHLVKNALRMRPDRIILGECRGGEAFDMLQAMNTGHEGSLTTVHANTCRDAISRLEQMIGMAGMDLPVKSIRAQIASAVDVIIQLERMSDGKRRLVSVHELTGMEGEVVTMQEIFQFRREYTDADGTIHGQYWATGIRPKFAAKLKTMGIYFDDRLFNRDRPLGENTLAAKGAA